MSTVVAVGAQWGDEGKGKIVDWLGPRADLVARFQGGNNAGHTLVVDGEIVAALIDGEEATIKRLERRDGVGDLGQFLRELVARGLVFAEGGVRVPAYSAGEELGIALGKVFVDSNNMNGQTGQCGGSRRQGSR